MPPKDGYTVVCTTYRLTELYPLLDEEQSHERAARAGAVYRDFGGDGPNEMASPAAKK